MPCAVFWLPLPLAADPAVPGAVTTLYASLSGPRGLAFSTNGTLFVGRDPSAVGYAFDNVYSIAQVGRGGAPVAAFGNPGIPDPQAVVLDQTGCLSGVAGAVLVGGVATVFTTGGQGGLISRIAPDGTVTWLFGPTRDFLNPTDFALDLTGRLLFTDYDGGQVMATRGLPPARLFAVDFPVGIAVDKSNRIVLSTRTEACLRLYSQDGTLINPRFAPAAPGARLTRGPGGSWGEDLFTIDPSGALLRVDQQGKATRVGSGFRNLWLQFGFDGSLYASDFAQGSIWQITPGRWWLDADILANPGSSTNVNGILVVRSSGAYLGTSADSCHFVYAPLNGDATVVARVRSMQDPDGTGWAKAGVMIRESLLRWANMVAMDVTAGQGACFERRGLQPRTTSGVSAPSWVKLSRRGNLFNGYWSADGLAWRWAGSSILPMAQSVYAGLVVTSDNGAMTNTVEFESAQVVGVDPGAPSITAEPADVLAGPGAAARFRVEVQGTAPLVFQWLLNNVPLADTSRLQGSTGPELTITNLQLTDSGNYSVALSNAAGVVTSATAVLSVRDGFDFNAGLPPQLRLAGSARWVSAGGVTNGGYVSLTEATGWQRGALVLPDLAQGAPIAGFRLDLQVRVGGGTASPGDGFSINFARAGDPVLTDPLNNWATGLGGTLNLPEEGTTTGVGIGFDAWPDTTKDLVGISVRVDNQLIAQYPLPKLNGSANDATSLQTGPQSGPLGWVPVRIELHPNGQLDIAYKDTPIVSGLPTAYYPSSGQFVFAAKTFWGSENHHLDDLQIQTTLGTPSIHPLLNLAASIARDNHYYDGTDLVISNCTVTLDGRHWFKSLTLLSNAVLTHPACTDQQDYSLELLLDQDLVVDATSRIDLSRRGYESGWSLGNVREGASTGSGGGSYGGSGGVGLSGGSANAVYGDFRDPRELGSGASDYGSPGGSGGGLLRLTARSAALNGSVLANGGDGTNGNAGGSGGGICLRLGTLSGTGAIAANGGAGDQARGGGGGGRIALYYDDAQGFDLGRVTATGGSAALSQAGGAGTVYLNQAGSIGVLRIDNSGVIALRAGLTPLGLPYETQVNAENLEVSGSNAVVVPATTLTLNANNVTVLRGGTLSHYAATASDEFALALFVTNRLTVDVASKIDVSGCGYLTGRTYGNTVAGISTGHSGASYGGMGGTLGSYGELGGARYGAIANASYGDFRNPNELGSGGGNWGAPGGAGGGLARLTALEAVIEGSILANGLMGTDNTGGGSGGGVLLNVSTISGHGAISANGGRATVDGGGGGGGRVAIYYATASGFDLTHVAAFGGQGGSVGMGGPGTVYLKPAQADGVLRLDNGVVSGAVRGKAVLGLAGHDTFCVENLLITGTNVVVQPKPGVQIQAGSLALLNGALLTHQAAVSNQEFMLSLLVTNTLSIDPTSQIDVSGRGYEPGRTFGNATAAASTGRAGGSYGGLGGTGASGGAANRVYGTPPYPNEPGSGGGNAWGDGGVGGGLVRVTAGMALIQGTLRADGTSSGAGSGAGGSGGGILLNVGTLSGAGKITANGAAGTGGGSGGGGGGGGGRIALYCWKADLFDPSRITAAGGSAVSGVAGRTGSVAVATSPWVVWDLPADGSLLHGSTPIAWTILGLDAFNGWVDLTSYHYGVPASLATRQAMIGGCSWNTLAGPDGPFEIRLAASDPAGNSALEVSRQVSVNNSAIWHSGIETAGETWAAGVVHLVEGDYVVGYNGRLTIAPGAVIKFVPGSSISVRNGGVLTTLGTSQAPVTLTASADDSAGGDANKDNGASQPRPGSWLGLNVATGGILNANEFADFRYLKVMHGGTLRGDETWYGSLVHWVTNDVIVPNGLTLTIRPGATVKFDPAVGLQVLGAGRLAAQGTVAQPIVFTSILDDSAGGDTNGDGNQTTPSAGDWKSLYFSGGQGNLDHCRILYSGGPAAGGWASGKGALMADAGGVVNVANSLIKESFYDGILAWSQANATNCTLAGIDRAVCAHPGGTVFAVNLTVNDNRIGLLVHGGTMSVANTVVANSIEAGVLHNYGPDALTIRSSDVWSTNATATNYSGTADQTGKNGNISADPKLKHPERDNYRLNFGSPCIDAADGTWSLSTDFMGAPRYTDPRSPHTGIPGPDGAYPDMGAFEFVENAPSDLDLAVNWVEGPSDIVAGQTATVRWQVMNAGSGQVIGPWHDAISLVADSPTRGVEKLDLIEALTPATLGPGDTVTAEAKVTVPGGTEGTWRWQVQANSQGEVFEGRNWTNNLSPLSAATTLRVPDLAIGPPQNQSFAGPQQPAWFKVAQPAGQDLVLMLDAAATNGRVRLYVGFDSMPTESSFDLRSAEWNSLTVRVGVAAASAARTLYLLAVPELTGNAKLAYTIQAVASSFGLSALGLSSGGNAGNVTIPIIGTGFGDGFTVVLQRAAAGATNVIAPVRLLRQDSANALATFNLKGAEPGLYDVVATQSGAGASLTQAFQIVPGVGAKFNMTLVMPQYVRIGRVFQVVLQFANEGDADMPVPLVYVENNGGCPMWMGSQAAESTATSLQFLAMARDGGSGGVLRPGEKHSLTFYTKVTTDVAVAYSASWASGDSQDVVDWSGIEAAIRPAGATAAWDQAWNGLVQQAGPTVSGYIGTLDRTAAALGNAMPDFPSPGLILRNLMQRQVAHSSVADLAGTVYNSDTGQAISQAWVLLLGTNGGPVDAVQSAWDGSFAFFDAAPGQYTINVAGFLPLPAATVTVPADAPLSLLVSNGATISGQVLSAAGGAPIPGANVAAYDDIDQLYYSTIADDQGRYAISGVAPGTYSVEIGADAFVSAFQQVVILAPGTNVACSVELESGFSVSGKVLDPQGLPVPGASVWAFPTNSANGKYSLTDESGGFTLAGLAAGTYRLLATATNYAWGALEGLAIPQQPPVAVTLALAQSCTVTGTVTDAQTGLPLTNATVAVESFFAIQGGTPTDTNGGFILVGLPPGPQTVGATAPGHFYQAAPVVADPAVTSVANLVLRSSGSISGRVLLATGEWVGHVPVSLASTNGLLSVVFASADGAFSFDGLADARYELAVGYPLGMGIGRSSVDLAYPTNQAVANLTLPGVELQGRVLSPLDGQPLPGVWVELDRAGQPLAHTLTDTNGQYGFLTFGLGAVEVNAAGPEAGFLQLGQVSISTNAVQTVPDVVGGKETLEVRLAWQATGLAVNGALVTLQPGTGLPTGMVLSCSTPATGQVIFSNLLAGNYLVQVTADGAAPVATNVSLTGINTRLDVPLNPGAIVAGSVLDEAGAPVSNALVCLVEAATGQASLALADDGGLYQVRSLRDGYYDLWCSDSRGRLTRIPRVRAAAAQTNVVDVSLAEPADSCRGQIVDDQGRAAIGAEVLLLNPAGVPMLATCTDPEGYYELPQQTESGLQLQAVAGGTAPLAAPLPIADTAGRLGQLQLAPPNAMALSAPALVRRPSFTGGGLGPRSKDDTWGAYNEIPWYAVYDWVPMWACSIPSSLRSKLDLEPYPLPHRHEDDTDEWRGSFRDRPVTPPACETNIFYRKTKYACELSYRGCITSYQEWVAADRLMRENAHYSSGAMWGSLTRFGTRIASLATFWEDAVVERVAMESLTTSPEEQKELATYVNTILSGISSAKNAAEAGSAMSALEVDLKWLVENMARGADFFKGTKLYGPWATGFNAVLDLARGVKDAIDYWGEDLYLEENRLNKYHAYLDSMLRHQTNMNTMNYILANRCAAEDPNPEVIPAWLRAALGLPPTLKSVDPNDKLTIGSGPEGFIAPGARLVYTIRFENQTNATAAAQRVVITDPLDPNLDWSTFELLDLGFNLVDLPVPPGLDHYATNTVVATDSNNIVAVRAALDPVTGVASWTMQTVDPITQDVPEDPLAGFLPPNDAQHRGEGYVSYSIRPQPDRRNGTVITNRARIVFDVNAPIDTPTTTNTVDLLPPASAVRALPATSTASFQVSWSGTDDPHGSGLASFDLYVSTDGGAFVSWLAGVTNTSSLFTGVPGSTYRFFSVARDQAGNLQPSPVVPDAATTVTAAPSAPVLQIRCLPAGLLQASWPTSAVYYVLQTVPALNAQLNWSTVTNRPAIAGTQFTLTLSPQGAARYYRLYALPQLAVQWTNNQVMLSWPKSAAGFRLATATDLAPATPWQAMSYSPLTNGDQCLLFVVPANPRRYYRLVTP